jgi:hypothetical protein
MLTGGPNAALIQVSAGAGHLATVYGAVHNDAERCERAGCWLLNLSGDTHGFAQSPARTAYHGR